MDLDDIKEALGQIVSAILCFVVTCMATGLTAYCGAPFWLIGVVCFGSLFGSFALRAKLSDKNRHRSNSTYAPKKAVQKSVAPQAKPTFTAQTSTATQSAASQKVKQAKENYTILDFLISVPVGVLAGFVPYLVFGLMTSLSRDSSRVNFFLILGTISMFLCIVVVTKRQMKVARENRLRRHRDREFTENMTATLRKNLSESMATIERGFRFDSQESMERYGKACDYLVYCCSEYMFGNHREFSHIIKPYRDQCYSNTYPFVDWRNGSYQHIPGTDLAEEIAKAEKIVVQKQQEEFERRLRSNIY